MLDIKYIKDNKDSVKNAVKEKHLSGSVDVDKLLETYDTYLELLKKVELHRNLKNNLSKDISKVSAEERINLLEEAKTVKAELSEVEHKLDEVKSLLDSMLLLIPNVISPDVPVAPDDSGNVVLRKVGTPKEMDFTPKDHVAIGESLGLLDIDTAGQVSGSRFSYIKNELALIQFALINLCLEVVTNEKTIGEIAKKVGNKYSKPFSMVIPPVFIKPEVMKRMDRLDPIEERYYIPSDDLVLVGSAEHTLGPILMDKTVELKELPVRYIGYSTAFRREAGSYGKDVRGIIRVHQFDKLEMESFVSQEDGEAEQQLFVGIQEYIVSKLGIPYQVVQICTGDMGKPDYKQIDIECWMPGENKYRETHTSDYMTDFQSRRLNAAYKDETGTRKYLYMNDATCLAIGRILVAILENYQQKDGSVLVPEALKKYLSFEVIESHKS